MSKEDTAQTGVWGLHRQSNQECERERQGIDTSNEREGNSPEEVPPKSPLLEEIEDKEWFSYQKRFFSFNFSLKFLIVLVLCSRSLYKNARLSEAGHAVCN